MLLHLEILMVMEKKVNKFYLNVHKVYLKIMHLLNFQNQVKQLIKLKLQKLKILLLKLIILILQNLKKQAQIFQNLNMKINQIQKKIIKKITIKKRQKKMMYRFIRIIS